MRLHIRHMTSYRFDAPVPYGVQRIRLFPKTTHGQTVARWDMTVEGGRAMAGHLDHHQNHVSLVIADEGAQELRITCDGEVETSDTVGVVGPHSGPAPLWLFRQSTPLTRAGAEVRRLAAMPKETDPVARLHELAALIIGAVPWTVGSTDVGTTAEQALKAGQGVCQDHAHIFIAAARLLGYPARYVSGYLKIDGQVDQDAAHGWAEAHVEPLGWIGFDISNRISPDTRYVRVATGGDYQQAAPVSGVIFGGQASDLLVTVSVEQ